jgi:hypothetical protein
VIGRSTKDIEFMASFTRSDNLSGSVRATKVHLHSFGKELKVPYTKLALQSIAESQIFMLPFRHSHYERHFTKLLENVVIPEREVDDFEINTINRRPFNGERAIKMLERILGFEANVSNI